MIEGSAQVHYLLTPFHEHFDYGFGAVGDSFKVAADSLMANPESNGSGDYLPVSFLYRHAIELHLKSAIIIFHRRCKLPYGSMPFDGEPHIPVGTKWKPMYSAHRLDSLYAHVQTLLSKYSEYLRLNTRTDWVLSPLLDRWMAEIDSTDPTSTYFRYPITRQGAEDSLKSVNREEDFAEIQARMSSDKPVSAFVYVNEQEEVVQSFLHDDSEIVRITGVLRDAANELYGLHAALRGELTGSR